MMQQTTTMPGALVTTAPGPIYTSSQGQVLTTGGPMVTTTSGMGYQAGVTNAPGSTSITRNVEQYSTTSGQPIVPHQGYNTMGPISGITAESGINGPFDNRPVHVTESEGWPVAGFLMNPLGPEGWAPIQTRAISESVAPEPRAQMETNFLNAESKKVYYKKRSACC
eukprot:Trichotokara_eunicae@DN4197_c0_g1_i1.p1